MMIRNQGLLFLLVSLGIDASVVRALSILHVDESGLCSSSKENIHLIRQAADALLRNDNRPALFHTSVLYQHTRSLSDELNVRYMKEGEEKLLMFLVPYPKTIQQIRSTTHTLLSFVIITKEPVDYNERENLKKWKVMDEMRKSVRFQKWTTTLILLTAPHPAKCGEWEQKEICSSEKLFTKDKVRGRSKPERWWLRSTILSWRYSRPRKLPRSVKAANTVDKKTNEITTET